MKLSDYTELNERIHAPKELKAKVLAAAAQTASEKTKKYQGLYSRGWSVLQKAAAAAILLVCLPVTAYAAAKGFGLLDYLDQLGIENLQDVEKLVVTPSEIPADVAENQDAETEQIPAHQDNNVVYRTQYAQYTVEEAILDSNIIFIAAKVTPLDSRYLLIPDISFSEDVFTIEGVEVGTAEEYAASEGKEIVYAGIRFGDTEGILEGAGYSYKLAADGSVYYYCQAANSFGSKEILLQCTGLAHTAAMAVADRVEFEVYLTDQSTATTKKICTTIDPAAVLETGVQVNSITFEETELGTYVHINYTIVEPKFEYASLQLLDVNGEELPDLPGAVTGPVENPDGSLTATRAYQKLKTTDGLVLVIKDVWNTTNVEDPNYGPYSFR